MKVLILLTALAVPVGANETCNVVSEMAENAARANQMGMPLVGAMGHAGDNDVIKQIVMEAYEDSRYYSEKVQEKVIGRFRDRWYLACLRASM